MVHWELRERSRSGVALAALCGASFLAVVDTTIVNIALPSIRSRLGMTLSGSQWVLNSYALVFGGLLLLSGRLGDRWGRRRLFVCGLVGFGVGSAMAAAAVGPAMLLAGRALQGLAAAAFVPSSLSLLTSTFTRARERSRALSVYGAMAGLGFVTGMVGGGVITDLWGWRSIFWINLPIVTILTMMTRALREGERSGARGPVDVGGAVTATIGLVAVIFALTAIPTRGWLSIPVLGPGSAGVVALIVFGMLEHRHRDPLVPPSVVARSSVAVPNLGILLQSMVGVAWLFLLTLFLQDVRGLNPLASGLWFAPMTLASVAGAVAAGRVVIRFGRRASAVTGQVLMAAGLLIITAAVVLPGGFAGVIIGMVLGEAGFMLGSVAFTIAATSSLEDRHAGLAAGLLNSATQLGGGLGLGIVTAVTAARDDPSSGAQLGFVACLAFATAALPLAGRLTPGVEPPRGRLA